MSRYPLTSLQAKAVNNLDAFMVSVANPYMRHYDRNAVVRRGLRMEPLSRTTSIPDCYDNCERNHYGNEDCFVECQKMHTVDTFKTMFTPKLSYYVPGTR